ncbi:hypothetical protein EB796_002516 [Bugula neritina]|uniref:Uncharacterized protein n=1 Tax=Bugula neritina TaxID=10212 RepID=A0A7J7KLY7_BUGNE|nr:hypothetical protein EB796_002516 [Bugula neritina]
MPEQSSSYHMTTAMQPGGFFHCKSYQKRLKAAMFIFGIITYKHTANISYFIWAILFIAVMLMFKENNTSSFS